MKYTFIQIGIFATLLTSCGPSAEQLAAEEKRKLDSAALAGQEQLLKQQAEEQAAAAEAVNQETLRQQLIELKGMLAGAEFTLQDLQGFKLLRSADVKAIQIAEQTKAVEEIKARIVEVEKQIKK